MNYYKDGSDYIEGYNPIISDTRIPERYNPDNDIDCLDCLDCLYDMDFTEALNQDCPFKDCPLQS